MANRNYWWLLILVFLCGQLTLAQAAPSMTGSSVCFSVGEVATRSYVWPGSKGRPAGRDAQKAHVVQVAGKIRAEIAPDDVERIVYQAFHEPQVSGQELGKSMAAECLKRGGFSAVPELVNVCFEVARYTGEFALGKRFNPLDRQLQSIDKMVTDPLERKLTRDLAHKVYQSKVAFEESHRLATEFYSECLKSGGTKP